MFDPFCLSTVLPTSGTQVGQAKSDQSSKNSIFGMGATEFCERVRVRFRPLYLLKHGETHVFRYLS